MEIHIAAELPDQKLRAEADPEEGLLFRERHSEPIDLAADEVFPVVGAHRAAEQHGAGVVRHRLGQRLAQARAANVERVAAAFQRLADAAGRRMLLVQDDQDGVGHRNSGAESVMTM